MRTRCSKIVRLVAVLLFLAATSSAWAQTNPPPDKPQDKPQDKPTGDKTQTPPDQAPPPVTEEITVVGLGESLREAVKVKREETAIVDAIVAKDVNKLPDKNLAEAASRVPG